MAIYLKVIEGTEKQTVKIGVRPVFIGRSSKCHITVSDSMVSGKHLAIKINDESRVVIKDLDTTNGTYLNGNKIGESLFYLEDFIQVGRVKITLDAKEMSSSELKLHQRDFERTNVTFVKLGAHLTDDDEIEDDIGIKKQKTLLAKIRKKGQTQAQTDAVTKQTEASTKSPQQSIIFDKDSSYNSLKKNQEIEQEDEAIDEQDSPSETGDVENSSLESEDDYEEEYEDEEQNNPNLVSKLKGFFKKK